MGPCTAKARRPRVDSRYRGTTGHHAGMGKQIGYGYGSTRTPLIPVQYNVSPTCLGPQESPPHTGRHCTAHLRDRQTDAHATGSSITIVLISCSRYSLKILTLTQVKSRQNQITTRVHQKTRVQQ